MTARHRPLKLLIVEDSISDIELVTEILEDSQIPCHLNIARDGEEALLFLHQQGHHDNISQPDLILLDLNLPKKNGYEVLADIKTDPQLRRIPVIVFTTSDLQQDVLRAYDLHANAYMLKSDNFSDLLKVLRSVENYWLSTVKLPSTF